MIITSMPHELTIKALSPEPLRTSLPNSWASDLDAVALGHISTLIAHSLSVKDFVTSSPLDQWLGILSSSISRDRTTVEALLPSLLERHAKAGELWSPELEALAQKHWKLLPKDSQAPTASKWLSQGAAYFASLSREQVVKAWNNFPSHSFRGALAQYAQAIPVDMFASLLSSGTCSCLLSRTDLPAETWHALALYMLPHLEPTIKTYGPTMLEETGYPSITSQAYSSMYAAIQHLGSPPRELYGQYPELDLVLDVLDPQLPPPTAPHASYLLNFVYLSRRDLEATVAIDIVQALMDTRDTLNKNTGVSYYSRVKLSINQFLYLPLGPSALAALVPLAIATDQDALLKIVQHPQATALAFRAALNAPSTWTDIRPALAKLPLARADAQVRTRLERCRITSVLAELIKDPDPQTFDRLWPRLLKNDPDTALDIIEQGQIPPTVVVTRSTLAPLFARGTMEQRTRALKIVTRLAPAPGSGPQTMGSSSL